MKKKNIILVTGGAGFIGSSLIKYLVVKKYNYKIISLDNYSSGSIKNHIKNQKEAVNLSENFKKKKLHLVSVHGMSSMRHSSNSDCTTNLYGKLNNYKNIFINDASIMPGNTGESPQATIMAFAKFVTKNIKI